MTVMELIWMLEGMDPDATVYVPRTPDCMQVRESFGPDECWTRREESPSTDTRPRHEPRDLLYSGDGWEKVCRALGHPERSSLEPDGVLLW